MKITAEDVLRVAELAHLELAAEETEIYQRQLDSILTYVEKLGELDTAEVEPLAQPLFGPALDDKVALRGDSPADCGTAAQVLPGAPDPSAPYFRVPKVIDR